MRTLVSVLQTQNPVFLVIVVILWSMVGFLSLGPIDILSRMILGCGCCPVPCRMFNRIDPLTSPLLLPVANGLGMAHGRMD